MANKRKPKLFELGGHWLDREPDRAGFWHYWFDAGSGRVRRAKLASEDLEAAKLEIARAIVLGAPKSAASFLATVLETYFVDVTDQLPSKMPARRAGAVVQQFFDAKGKELPRCTDLTADTQAELAAWCATTG